ncbi:MAG: hypothetical protein HYV37_01795 [Candidatus Levyibacteriota bacterium]|nr:MAG: hypothetical protein HYV37_01795 [Candidatus Levybacteria bacterium]
MAKARPTRKEKIIADHHKKLQLQASYSIQSYSPTHIYSYLMRDIIKTCFLTGGIIIGELILSYMVKNQVVKIPFITY